MSLGGICLVAGFGGKNERSGTYDYYMSEPIVEDDAKGVGPFLLAYTEMFTLAKQVAASTASIMPLFIAGSFYYIFNFLVAMVMEKLEKRMQYFN